MGNRPARLPRRGTGPQLVESALRHVFTQLPDIWIGTPEEGFSNLCNHMNHLPATWTPKGA
jgi:hypothetical protein